MNQMNLLRMAYFIRRYIHCKSFDLNVITCSASAPGSGPHSVKLGPCGYAGMQADPIGWMPACFPELTRWDAKGLVRLIANPDLYDFEAAYRVFEISHSDLLFLFSPSKYRKLGTDQREPVSRRITKFAGIRNYEALDAMFDNIPLPPLPYYPKPDLQEAINEIHRTTKMLGTHHGSRRRKRVLEVA